MLLCLSSFLLANFAAPSVVNMSWQQDYISRPGYSNPAYYQDPTLNNALACEHLTQVQAASRSNPYESSNVVLGNGSANTGEANPGPQNFEQQQLQASRVLNHFQTADVYTGHLIPPATHITNTHTTLTPGGTVYAATSGPATSGPGMTLLNPTRSVPASESEFSSRSLTRSTVPPPSPSQSLAPSLTDNATPVYAKSQAVYAKSQAVYAKSKSQGINLNVSESQILRLRNFLNNSTEGPVLGHSLPIKTVTESNDRENYNNQPGQGCTLTAPQWQWDNSSQQWSSESKPTSGCNTSNRDPNSSNGSSGENTASTSTSSWSSSSSSAPWRPPDQTEKCEMSKSKTKNNESDSDYNEIHNESDNQCHNQADNTPKTPKEQQIFLDKLVHDTIEVLTRKAEDVKAKGSESDLSVSSKTTIPATTFLSAMDMIK